MKIHIIALCLLLNFVLNNGYAQVLEPSETEVLVNVSVTNTKAQALKSEIFIFKGISSKKVFTGVTDESGKFSLLLPKGDTYSVIYQDLTDTSTYSTIEIPGSPGKFTSKVSIEVEPAKVYTLKNVLFDTGKATLKASSYAALNDLVEIMKIKPTMQIEIGGHTDNTGTTEINIKLSQERADAVMNYLVKKGIAANRLTAKGYGDSKPIADNSTESGKTKNRRTEVKVIKD